MIEFRARGDYGGARELVRVDTPSFPLLLELARLEEELGDYDEAERQCFHALDAAGDEPSPPPMRSASTKAVRRRKKPSPRRV